jgi:HEPN domain-containing protein
MAKDEGSPSQEFTAEVYRAAASEHLPIAATLYDSGEYLMASYIAGLAVEAILRAYQLRLDPEFDARHDLQALSRSAKFGRVLPEREAAEYSQSMTIVVARWTNSHRFRSRAAFARWLKRVKLDRGIKGDFVKENCRRLLIASTRIVKLGLNQWQL